MIKNNSTSRLFFLAAVFLFTGAASYSQIKIGDNLTTVGSSSMLELESTDKALLISRIANTAAIATPVDGMIVYDISSHCIKIYANGAWSECYTATKSTDYFFTVSLDGVKDKKFGDGKHDFIYMPITGEDGRIWLNNNLGADYANMNHASFDPTIQATSYNDHHAYGSLFQWGRAADGHELVSWSNSSTGTLVNGTTTTNADVPANMLFIIEASDPYDWRTTQDATLWDGLSATNNPCPANYRIPTDAELTGYAVAATISNRTTAAASDAALTSPGSITNDATITDTGAKGFYWSSTTDGTNSQFRYIDDVTTNSSSSNGYRAKGYSVRCIRN